MSLLRNIKKLFSKKEDEMPEEVLEEDGPQEEYNFGLVKIFSEDTDFYSKKRYFLQVINIFSGEFEDYKMPPTDGLDPEYELTAMIIHGAGLQAKYARIIIDIHENTEAYGGNSFAAVQNKVM